MKRQLVDKFIQIKAELEAAHGAFVVFALFEFVGTPGIDVVFSAEWTRPRPDSSVVAESIGIMSEEVLKVLSKDDIRLISHLQPLAPTHRVVIDLLSEIHPEELHYIPHLILSNIFVQDFEVSRANVLAADLSYIDPAIPAPSLQVAA